MNNITTTLQENREFINQDIYNLSRHMEQCKKQLCYTKEIKNLALIGFQFFTGRIVTNLIFLAVGAIFIKDIL